VESDGLKPPGYGEQHWRWRMKSVLSREHKKSRDLLVDMLTQRGAADSSYNLDLFDYLRLLLRRWKWVAGPTLVALACAGLYLFLAAPVYQARTTLLPPTPASIAGYNQDNGRVGLPVWDPDKVYGTFQKYLFSDSLRLSFFRETVLPELSERQRRSAEGALRRAFDKQLQVLAPDRLRPYILQVDVLSEQPQQAADWANAYVRSAERLADQEIRQTVEASIHQRSIQLQRQIDLLRETARKRREDRIAALKEAQQIARSVGLESPQVSSIRVAAQDNLASFIDGSLLYLRGSKAISEEIALLEARQSDDPFIESLRDLEEQKAFLGGIRMPDSMRTVQVDQLALPPDVPVKPRAALILLAALLIGLIAGTLLASVIGAAAMRKGEVRLA